MKFKLQAGAELDILSAPEVRQILGSWFTEVTRGIKFRQFSGRAALAGGVWTIGGNATDNRQDVLGPEPGLLWAVTRIAVSGNGFVPGTDAFSVYIDEVTPSKLIESGLTRGARWDVPIVQLNGGERLTLSGVGTGVNGTDVVVSGQAVEVPAQLAWQLL